MSKKPQYTVFSQLLAELLKTASKRSWRFLLCIEGTRDEALQLLQQHWTQLHPLCEKRAFAWFSAAPNTALGNHSFYQTLQQSLPEALIWQMEPVTASQRLGHESGLLVYDAHNGLYADALAALSGTLVGGGLLILLLPDREKALADIAFRRRDFAAYPYQPEDVTTLAEQRFLNVIASDPASAFWQTEIQQGCFNPPSQLEQPTTAALPDDSITIDTSVQAQCLGDQSAAVAAISRVALGHRKRPLVLQADRGRGKSAALGLALTSLFKTGYRGKVILTAPSKQAAGSVFAFIEESIQQHIEFMAPDALAQQLANNAKPGDLLLVDEAAAIPLPLLESFLGGFSRLVFSSTVHGYEGSGRGFAIRFQQMLEQHFPQWRKLEMQKPIRWSEGCPLETRLFSALLLNTETPELPEHVEEAEPSQHIEDANVRLVDRKALIEDAHQLSSIFALLVNAHYKTSPDDLWVMLNAPGISVYMLEYKHVLIGAALVNEEGGFEASVAEQIWQGERRLHNHLLPQVLAQQLHNRQALGQSYHRIVRIAVHPHLQGRGWGSKLLQGIETTLKQQKPSRDFLGSSFSASAEVATFWQKNGYATVRCGLTRQASSAAPSLLVLKAMDAPGEALLEQLVSAFAESFVEALPLEFSELDASLVEAIISSKNFRHACQKLLAGRAFLQSNRPDTDPIREIDNDPDIDGDKELLQFFVEGKRQLHACYRAGKGRVLLLAGSSQWHQLSQQQKTLLIQVFLQRLPEQRLCVVHKLGGKKALKQVLAESLAILL